LLVFTLAAFGQANPGIITGAVTGPDRVPVPLLQIQAKNVETGTIYRGLTSPTGDYRIAQLPPGTYELSTNDPLFSPYQQKDIKIQAGQTLRVDVRLGEGVTLSTLGEDRPSFAAIFGRRPAPPTGATPRTPTANRISPVFG
jgi:hypothetical protein